MNETIDLSECRIGTLARGHYLASGYHGPLCMRCSEQYYAASGSCVECKGVGLPPLMVKALAFVPRQHGMGFLEEMCCRFCML